MAHKWERYKGIVTINGNLNSQFFTIVPTTSSLRSDFCKQKEYNTD
jgi:hypothetical protein